MTETLVAAPGIRSRARDRGVPRTSGVGGELDRVACRTIRVLHDRRIPGSRTSVDHLVVTPAGVWVIDAIRDTGRPELRVDGGILRPRSETLLVGRRDRTALVDAVLRRTDAVRAAIGVPVLGALCFADADWPMLGGSFRLRGIEVLWPRRLAELLRDSAHPAAVSDVAGLATDLSELLVRA